MSTVTSYRGLQVWQSGIELTHKVYLATQRFPKQEQYGIVSQMQRAVASIPANIAEGHTRDSTKEFLRHLSIALGSLAELETWLTIARRLNYVDLERTNSLVEHCDHLGRSLRNLQKALRRRLK
jgi:four helix bundle protein